MARVIVILALMLLISALIFGLTRKQGASATSGVDAEAHTTVPLAGSSDAGSSDKVAPPSGTAAVATEGAKPSAGAQTAQDVMSGMASGAAPAFSTVGVDNRGRASFTGTASPGDDVSIVHAGKTLGSGRADPAGNWTIDFKVPNVREDFPLALSARRSSGQTVSSPQRAVVSPPDSAGGLQHITLETIPAESKPAVVATSGQPEIGIVIEKVEADQVGTAVLKGKSDAGATLRASIDGVAVGDTKVGADGKWILAVRNDTGKDANGVRIVLSGADGQELDRADVPLKLAANEVKTASPATPAAVVGTAVAAATAASTPAVSGAGQKGHYVKVRRGDSLWRIARRHYGNGRRWTRIYNANRRKIQDPDFLKPGRRIYLPD